MNSISTATTLIDGTTVTNSTSGTLKEKLNTGNANHLPVDEASAPVPHHIRDPRDSSKHTFFSRAFRSDEPHTIGGKDYLGLPFRLTVYTAQDHVARNVPYLRHSWNRIDFIAIVSFWIAFTLAQTGVERGSRDHIAIFRALSVLRTSRLLAVTNGTTVSRHRIYVGLVSLKILLQTIMRSLKRARPLLTNVAYFVLFAMILFS